MTREELIIGFFEKGYCCDLDEVKDTCLGLLKENEELKKQVEKVLNDYCRLDAYNRTQQKKFIKYINDGIKELEKERPNKLQNIINLGIIDITKTILQKYKNIIGVSDEKK